MALSGPHRRGRIAALQERNFESFGPGEGLANEFVGAVLEDRGAISGRTNRGLFRRHAAKFERIDEELHLPTSPSSACGRHVTARFWQATGRLFRVEDGKLRPYGPNEHDGVYYIGEAADEHSGSAQLTG